MLFATRRGMSRGGDELTSRDGPSSSERLGGTLSEVLPPGRLGELLASRLSNRGQPRPASSSSTSHSFAFPSARDRDRDGSTTSAMRAMRAQRPHTASSSTSGSSSFLFSSSYSTGANESKQGNDGEAYSLEHGEVGFDVTLGRSSGFRFSGHDRVAHSPIGPIMLLSTPFVENALSSVMDSRVSYTMRWRIQISGNSSWGLGVVSESPPPHVKRSMKDSSRYSPRSSWGSYPDYLATQGRCGITTSRNALQKLSGLDGTLLICCIHIFNLIVYVNNICFIYAKVKLWT